MRVIERTEVISLIKSLSITCDEVVLDMKLTGVTFNSIEWRRKGNKIILHKFIDDFDFELEYDDLSVELRDEIYVLLLGFLC